MRTGWSTAVLVLALVGCENIDWGGADVAVVPPPPKAGDESEAAGPEEEQIPEGPILYYVDPTNGMPTLIPVGEIGPDTLMPVRASQDWESYGRGFIAAHLRPGTEFALFHRGARVGTMVLDTAGLPAAGVCPRVPMGRGVLELAAGADTISEFLAVAKPHTPPGAPIGVVSGPQPDRRMEILGPILAERLIRARGAPLPGSWSRAMVQLQPFPVEDSEDPAFASTLLVDDTLGTGFDDQGYSLFFIAEPVPELGYDTAYVAYTPYEQEGKAAPRVIDYLDWDQDGQTELLTEVYGVRDTWFEAYGKADAGWRRLLSTHCAESGRPGPTAMPADSAAQP